jgi:hypothetical protein
MRVQSVRRRYGHAKRLRSLLLRIDEVKEYRSILTEAVADYDENCLKIHGR